MASATQNTILLESGTNELEILVFELGEQRYGVNVAKVREVIEPGKVTSLPESHPAVLGVFQLRESVIPLIHLPRSLNKADEVDLAAGKIIVMEFNDARVGFFVDTVEQIYRVNWKDVAAMPDMEGVHEAPLTSIVHIKGDMILMLDFEKIVFDIGGVDVFAASAERMKQATGRGEQHILFAEDSHVMRKLIHGNLVKAGYTNVTVCTDGEEAWEKIHGEVSAKGSHDFRLLITDIEMPRMDGLHLCKRIKEHAQMQAMPVIVFSSLVSQDNQKKCQAVGANAQITKPQLDQLVDLMDRLLAEAAAGTGQAQAVPA